MLFRSWLALAASACGIGGLVVGYLYNKVFAGDLGIVRRYRLARAGHTFLKQKYYLDHLWTGIVINGIKGPIAQAAYWFNQNVLDGIVNAIGKGGVEVGKFTYEVIDQKVVDGAVNGSGLTASAGGGILRTLQNGKVQNYAAIFLGATGLIALALVLFV